jgi:hypothetical protein
MMPLSTAAILLYTSPIWIMLMSVLFFHEKLTRKKLIALTFAFAGCIMVSGVSGKRLTIPGLLIGLGSGIGYGLYSILGTVALRRYSPYTVTAYAYPGHEALQKVMAALIAKLAAENLPQCRVDDPSKEVFWNEWVENDNVRRLMLLNTDWTTADNRKKVVIDNGKIQFETEVVEREAKILTVLPNMILEPDSPELHVEVLDDGGIRCHGTGMHQMMIHLADRTVIKDVDLMQDTVTDF